jgi:hypothetical protein
MKTFILRLEVDETGRVLGVVERVRTGEKDRFQGYGMLVEIVSRMVALDGIVPPHGVNTQEARLCLSRGAD